MSDTQSDPNALDIKGRGSYSVIAVSFGDDDNAYARLTRLKELDSQHQVGIHEAVVVVHQPDGRIVEKDRMASFAVPNMGGGVIGVLVGIIGGPLGMLIGGTAGLFVGSFFHIEDADDTDSALSAISSSVRPGRSTRRSRSSGPSFTLGKRVLPSRRDSASEVAYGLGLTATSRKACRPGSSRPSRSLRATSPPVERWLTRSSSP